MKDYKENKSNLSETFCNEVYSVVREIPAGSVTTYGDIAALLGMPQYSRMVGRALRQVPAGLNLPCHRVVNAHRPISARMGRAAAAAGCRRCFFP